MACPIGPAIWTPLNLTEKFPGHRILDRNSPEYQMEAFMYTCVILGFYTVATGAFMVKFVLQARGEPFVDSDSTGASSGLPMVVKLREQERHRKLVERQARRDVKMQMINHLRQMSLTGASPRSDSMDRRTSVGSIETQMTSFSCDQKSRRPSMSGANMSPHRALVKSNSSTTRFVLPLSRRETVVERTFCEANDSVWPSPIYPCAYQPLTRVHSSLRYQNSNDTLDDTLVSL